MPALRIEELLAELAHGTPVPGAGPAAALVTAVASALAAMAARCSSDSWDEAAGAIAQAESLRARASRLGQEDAEAVELVFAARAADAEQRPESRDFRLGQALGRAA